MKTQRLTAGVILLGTFAFAAFGCSGTRQASPLPGTNAASSERSLMTGAASSGMCSIYGGFGTLSYCYDFDEASGTTLVDGSGAGHNGTISSTGITYHAAGLASNSVYAETTNGTSGSMTGGVAPASGSFSLSFFINLHSNANNWARLVASGNPAHSSPASGLNIGINSTATNNEVYAVLGYGTGSLTFGNIALPLNTTENVTLTYNATGNVATLCVGSGSSPKCVTGTLSGAYVASGNPLVFGGGSVYYPANATFDEAAFWQGTVLTTAQIDTIASNAGTGASPSPTPSPTPSPAPSSSAGPGMCSIYGGSGPLSFCYDFDEASGATLVDASGAGHNGTISATGVTYHASGLTSNSVDAETTDGTSGSMTSGITPAAGSFSLSFFVNLRSNAGNWARIAATGNPAHTSPASGWNITVDTASTNALYVNMGYGSGSAAFGYIPLAFNTPASVTLTYNATGNVATLCVGSGSSPTCKTQTLPAAYVASGKPVVFGGVGYEPSNATFDEAGYWQGTVLTTAQIDSFSRYAGTGTGASPTPSPSPSTAPSPSASFTDWPMYQNDAQHDGYVTDAAITPKTVGSLHLAWEKIGATSGSSHEQPVVATNVAGHAVVLYLGGAFSGNVAAFDGQSGASLWTTNVGVGTPAHGSQAGVRGTGAIDRTHSVVYFPDGQHRVHALALNGLADAWTPVDIAPTSPPDTGALHNLISVGMTLSPSGTLYAATGSASDITPWVGRLAAINTNTAAVTSTFYTDYNPGAGMPYSGGGIWSWGGAALDPSGNVYVDVGNADTTATSPFVAAPDQEAGYAEQTVKLSSGLSVLASALPPLTSYASQEDMDFSGTPTVFQPIGCADALVAGTGKSGRFSIYDTTTLANPPLLMITVAEASAGVGNIANPAYSPSTGLLYVNVPDTATAYASGEPGMIAIGFSGCTPSVVWNPGTAFAASSFLSGVSRSAPTVTSGGVVLVMAPNNSTGTGALFALDASSGALLNGGNPIFTANSSARMGPIVDGDWVWVSDSAGDLYGFTTDPSVPALARPSTVRRSVPLERDLQ